MHDVAIAERSVLATEEARVLLVHEEAEMGAQPPMFVMHPLREGRMRLNEGCERLTQRRGVERDVTRSARETAVSTV